jgi:ADP-heptose:LPS heptosyltransferase
VTERPKLLALRALGLGDMLTAIPALRALDRGFADHRRLLATPTALAPLVEMSGLAMEVVDATGLGSIARASRHPDVAVNLHGRGPQSHLVLLEMCPRRLIAFSNRHVPAGGPTWIPDEHEIDRWCRLLRESGISADPGDLRIDAPPEPPPPGTADAVVLHPGAKEAARRWPPDRWIDVARWARSRGWDVAITGSPAEAGVASRIAGAAGVPESAVWAGRTPLSRLAAIVAAARLVVCGDTGLAHLATALGTPSVVLFGPTPPSQWGPPTGGPHTVLWTGSRGDPHADHPDPGLLRITVSMVVEAMEERLSESTNEHDRARTSTKEQERAGSRQPKVASGR